jgi:CDP-glucose 4,6-dehydratase
MSSVPTEALWSGRRVLVTGHSGFKGAWVSLWLQALGAEVTGYGSMSPPGDSLYEAAAVGAGMREVAGDVRDGERLASALAEARPQVAFHLAAQPLVRRSFDDPIETFEINVMGTAHVLDAVRRTPGVEAVVNVTSDKAYENREWPHAYREPDPVGGHDPYSASKGCAELVTASYRRSFLDEAGTRVATARAGNVIGGGDWAEDRLVPDLARAALAGEPLRVRNPASVRPWQHVLNPLAGYLLLAERLVGGQVEPGAFNFGPRPEDAWPVRDVVERLARAWNSEVVWEQAPAGGPHEARLLRLDSGKADALLGWRPAWDLEEGLARTAEWYGTHAAGGDVRAVTLAQIDAYAAS